MQFSKITSLLALIKVISAAAITVSLSTGTDLPTDVQINSTPTGVPSGVPSGVPTDIPIEAFSAFPSGTAIPSGIPPQDGKNGTQPGFGGEHLNGTIPDFGGERLNGTIPDFGGEHLNGTHHGFGGKPSNGFHFEHPENFTHPPEDGPKGGFLVSGTIFTALPTATA